MKSLWATFANDFFGWDNKYLFTVKSLLLYPERVFQSYIDGTRKRYVAPFAFLAIGTALAMLVFNQYGAEYIELSNSISEKQFELMEGQLEGNIDMTKFEEQKSKQMKASEETQTSILKYFNLFTFFLIPLYTLMAFWVYRKPYNYGEHLVIACYAQGFLFLTSTLFFVLSLVVNPAIYGMSILVMVIYYLYAYGRLYNYKIGKSLLKLLRFLGINLLALLVLVLLGFIYGFFKAKFG